MKFFEELNSVDCSGIKKQKGKFDYVSYALAYDIIRKKGYDCRYEVVKNPETGLSVWGDSASGYMVVTNITISKEDEECTHTMWLPITDNKNAVIFTPNVRDINNSIMRCVAKGLATFGVGCHIFEGYSSPCVMPVITGGYSEYEALNVSPYVDTTYSGAGYLQWMKAIHLLLVNYPNATWQIVPSSGELWETTPFGTMVTISVKLDENTEPYVIQRPVLDKKNGADLSADTMAINTALMRCLAKAISFATGIGINLYAGEDLDYLSADSTSAIPTATKDNATKPKRGRKKKEDKVAEPAKEVSAREELSQKSKSISDEDFAKILNLYKVSDIDSLSEIQVSNLLTNWDKALQVISA